MVEESLEPATSGTQWAPGQAEDQTARLGELGSYEILGTPPEATFDDLTELAAYVCNVSMAVVSFAAADRRWIKSQYGVDFAEPSCDTLLRTHTGAAILEISDAEQDPRFAGHHMVVGYPYVRFYAGVPLVTSRGHVLGTLSVMDREPGSLSDPQRRHLQTVANQVVGILELRRRARHLGLVVEERQAADAALRQQHRVLGEVMEHTDVLIFAKDLDGRFVMANRVLEHVTHAEGGLVGKMDSEVFDAGVAGAYRRNDEYIMQTRELQVFNEEVTHPDGSVHTYRSTKFPLIDDSGAVIGVGGVSTDVTELVNARAAHAAAEQRWRALVEQSPAAVIVVDAEGKLAYVNPVAVVLCGAQTANQITSMSALDFVPSRIQPNARMMLETILSGGGPVHAERGVLRQMDGTEIAVEFTATAVNHSGELSMQLEVRDVSALDAEHAALKLSASSDPLTGVFNRRAWDVQVTPLLAEASAQGSALTIAVIDFDNFKFYNDTRGHTAGDALLQQFATAAAKSIREDDIFARWGGEEFIVALPNTTPKQAKYILNRIRGCVPFGQTCSIGYTAHRTGETLTDTVIRADQALYKAKKKGRNKLVKE